MLRQLILLLGVIAPSTPNAIPTITSRSLAVDERMLGRWDISIATPDGEKPSWIEIELSGGYRVRIGSGVKAAALRLVLDVLER